MFEELFYRTANYLPKDPASSHLGLRCVRAVMIKNLQGDRKNSLMITFHFRFPILHDNKR
jgi:hypothetical protein